MDKIRFEQDCSIRVPHMHEEMEILYVLNGKADVMLPSFNFVLNAEDFAIFNPYEHHEIYRENSCHTISFYIPQYFLRQIDLGTVKCYSSVQPEQEEYFSILRTSLANIYRFSTEGLEANELLIVSELFSLFSILSHQFQEDKSAETQNTAAPGTHIAHRDFHNIQTAIQYIGEHFQEDISLKDVADHVFLSGSYLSKEFQRITGISFSDYLRRIRMNHAAMLLEHTDISILNVAMNSGFGNANTLTANFNKEYQMTPREYRKNKKSQTSAVSDAEAVKNLGQEDISYMNLIKYSGNSEATYPLKKKQKPLVRLHLDINQNLGTLERKTQFALSIIRAESLLWENTRNSIRDAVRKNHFRFIYFYGIFNDLLDFYHELPDGTSFLSFTYVDEIFDFILSTGAKPFPVLCYTPRLLLPRESHLYGEGYNVVPSDLKKWKFIIDGFLEHLIERYDREEVAQWGFQVFPELFCHYGLFTLKEYMDCYFVTYDAIREHLPEVLVAGWQLDISFFDVDGMDDLRTLIRESIRRGAVPDLLNFQYFGCDFSKTERSEQERRILNTMGEFTLEPAPPYENPDYLKEALEKIRLVMREEGIRECPIWLCQFNSTIWQRDTANDTCFKSAYAVKNILENVDEASAISYSALSDENEIKIVHSIPYHGGFGMLNYQGIPKSVYHAWDFLNRIPGIIIAKGPGYVITRSPKQQKIQICLYNYNHFNPNTRSEISMSVQEYRTSDRYYQFEQDGTSVFHIYISGLKEGIYDKTTRYINQEHGSSYDVWAHVGAPQVITPVLKEYISHMSQPGYLYEQILLDNDGELLVSAILEQHEVRLITLEAKNR